MTEIEANMCRVAPIDATDAQIPVSIGIYLLTEHVRSFAFFDPEFERNEFARFMNESNSALASTAWPTLTDWGRAWGEAEMIGGSTVGDRRLVIEPARPPRRQAISFSRAMDVQ